MEAQYASVDYPESLRLQLLEDIGSQVCLAENLEEDHITMRRALSRTNSRLPQ
jgi:hypothetical protein